MELKDCIMGLPVRGEGERVGHIVGFTINYFDQFFVVVKWAVKGTTRGSIENVSSSNIQRLK